MNVSPFSMKRSTRYLVNQMCLVQIDTNKTLHYNNEFIKTSLIN